MDHRHVGTWRKRLGNEPAFIPEVHFNVDELALVVVDLQNYSCHPSCGWAPVLEASHPEIAAYLKPRLHEVVIPNTLRLLQAFRERGRPVIYLVVGSGRSDGADFIPFRMKSARALREKSGQETLARKGSFEFEIYEPLAPRPDEIVLHKRSRSAFTTTGIDQILRNMGITGLVFAGVASDSCVETTARDAADRGYLCGLVDDACAAIDSESHDATMKVFKRYFGTVLTTDEVLELLGAGPATVEAAAAADR